jgi:hypothetical protein
MASFAPLYRRESLYRQDIHFSELMERRYADFDIEVR